MKIINLCLICIVTLLAVVEEKGAYPAEGVQFINFIMSPSAKDNQRISFSPDDGIKFRESYEKKFGPKGRDLIEMLGQGTSVLQPRSTVYSDKNKNGKPKKVSSTTAATPTPDKKAGPSKERRRR